MGKEKKFIINQSTLLQQTIEQMPARIFWKDINYRYTGCNFLQAAEMRLNSIKEIVGKTDYDFYPKEIADKIRKHDSMVILDGESSLSEEQLLDKDNQPAIYLTQKTPLRNQSGEIVGLAGISFNVADRVRSEEQTRLEKEQAELTLSSILNNLPGHIYWKDVHFVYQGCNACQAQSIGLSSQRDIIGKTDFEMPWRSDAEEVRKVDRSVIKTKKMITKEEIWHHAKKNKSMVFLSTKTPLLDKNDNVIGILGISLDITERKKMEEDLRIAKEAAEAASRAKTEFIANMGHDIRTPLTGIIGMSHILEEELSRPDEREHAAIIHASGEQLLGLLNGVLDLITVDATTEDTVLQKSYDVRRVIHDILELERPAIVAHQLDIDSHIDDAIPTYVVGDKMKLHRILLNLAGNAIKFTKVGRIDVNAKLLSMQDNMVNIEFAVKDTGIGIPDELQDKVFDRFFKISPSYKGLYTGNGIGLHIAQKYAGLMGGELRLTSQVGVGTTFSFVLSMKIGQKPEDDDEFMTPDLSILETPMKAVEPIKTHLTSQNKPQVLIIEDNMAVMRVLMSMVKKYDVQVTSAVNAELAFQFVQSQWFDLIITDVGLSGQQGDELTAMIRAFEKDNQRQPTTIVGLTGHAVGKITQACLDAGMNMVYRKPIAPNALKALIEGILPNDSEMQGVSAGEVSLGEDLPRYEDELFELNRYPLLDLELAVHLLGSEAMARDIFKCLKAEGIDADLAQIKIAHERGDWKEVEALAHKMKGGAVFGTVRLHYALLYMERYRKAGHTRCLEKLYRQMLQVIDETIAYLEAWLGSTH